MEEIVVEDYAALRATLPHTVLDVREAWEFELCHLRGSRHIPLGELAQRVTELDRAQTLVVICHHGLRSRAAQAWLLAQGFAHVLNLAGGIDAWARRIDPSLSLY
ncbi:MAG TPA: rhodanese-like domain-containing protein [Gammaproteobacteria bacterium]|nr:rhodanese-like domain-containing protein [Gammaproteobacteria bacterium]